jgi:hypothetical protein
MIVQMLGELLFESKGKITGQRVLSVENGIPKLEVSTTGTGIFTGSLEVTETWTYWAIQRPDGTSYGEGQGVMMTKDGHEVATATGRGEGKRVKSGNMRYVGALFYETNSKNKFAFLNHLIGVNEYEVDASGNYEHKLWDPSNSISSARENHKQFFIKYVRAVTAFLHYYTLDNNRYLLYSYDIHP